MSQLDTDITPDASGEDNDTLLGYREVFRPAPPTPARWRPVAQVSGWSEGWIPAGGADRKCDSKLI